MQPSLSSFGASILGERYSRGMFTLSTSDMARAISRRNRMVKIVAERLSPRRDRAGEL